MAFEPVIFLDLPSRVRWTIAPGVAAGSGLALFGAVLLGLPVNTIHLAQFEALNRELGKLCGDPPQQALSVCRLHARLLKDL